MPVIGTNISNLYKDEYPFFDTLNDLDRWTDSPSNRLGGVPKYYPRPRRGDQQPNGRLLVRFMTLRTIICILIYDFAKVCHDYRGGYDENPTAFTYTFNFWPWCDIFVYFSHHRVTIPPSGWTTAAHRQGVKILGTLIFEHEASEGDCLRLLFGRLPGSQTGPAVPSQDDTVPVSPHYAHVLADLAFQRGFDGYLLNFEYPLRAGGGVGQTRALAAWIALLNRELKHKVGPHAEAIWYDSVVFTGQLRWQDRLNNYNLPFFLPATGFFTNYTWPANYPSITTKFFDGLPPTLNHLSAKSLQDIYTGIDVWGRGQHGGGGLGCYRSLEHINPKPSSGSSDSRITTRANMSVALFGPAWTWESEQDKPGWDWEEWWYFERKLWLGPEDDNEKVDVPDAPLRREGDRECLHGPFKPITAFFDAQSPPDPAVLPFYTSFCPGVGQGWWVNGKQVWMAENKQSLDGWTDVSKQGSIGDLLWPRPKVRWEDVGREETLPKGQCGFDFKDAWQGGNSLRVAFNVQGSDAEDAFFRSMWLPIQSFFLTPGKPYDAHIVFKSESENLDVGLSLRYPGAAKDETFVSSSEELANGWTKLSFSITAVSSSVHIGLIVGFAAEDPSQPFHISLLLGQLCVHPSAPLPPTLPAIPRILWADLKRSLPPAPSNQPEQNSSLSALFTGTLSWEISATFAPLPLTVSVPSAEDPNPIWHLDVSEHWFPSFVYFNIYVQPHDVESKVQGPEVAKFVGTTGFDGRRGRFWIGEGMFESAFKAREGGTEKLRFYVQGVTEKGEVLAWDRCCFVDT